MAKGYSKDLRVRAIELVEAGESAREAARVLNIGVSTAIRWAERWKRTGSVDAKPGTGHCRSPLEQHKQWLIDLIAAEPDLTLEEIRVRLRLQKKQKAVELLEHNSVGRARADAEVDVLHARKARLEVLEMLDQLLRHYV